MKDIYRINKYICWISCFFFSSSRWTLVTQRELWTKKRSSRQSCVTSEWDLSVNMLRLKYTWTNTVNKLVFHGLYSTPNSTPFSPSVWTFCLKQRCFLVVFFSFPNISLLLPQVGFDELTAEWASGFSVQAKLWTACRSSSRWVNHTLLWLFCSFNFFLFCQFGFFFF